MHPTRKIEVECIRRRCIVAVTALRTSARACKQRKPARARSSTRSTRCQHASCKKLKAEANHNVTKAADHNKQEVGGDCSGAWIHGSACRMGGTKPMQPNLAAGGPALASLIASPHDMARLTKWRLNRCVSDIVTFLACQQVSMP